MTSTARQQFIPAIESARGIAALCVCGLHCLMFWSAFPNSPENSYVMEFFVGAGNSAVTFFFVLSGFVLVMSLDKMKAEGQSLIAPHFVLSRIFRIYPAAVLVVLVFATIEARFIFHGLDGRPWTNTLR